MIMVIIFHIVVVHNQFWHVIIDHHKSQNLLMWVAMMDELNLTEGGGHNGVEGGKIFPTEVDPYCNDTPTPTPTKTPRVKAKN